jgi:glycosyltransferase involved in cell wall biosynthesis
MRVASSKHGTITETLGSVDVSPRTARIGVAHAGIEGRRKITIVAATPATWAAADLRQRFVARGLVLTHNGASLPLNRSRSREETGAMLSFVIPARNEAESLEALHSEIAAVCAREGYVYEVVIVDDGSTDATWARIEAVAAAHPQVRGVRLARNFGKGPALSAGFAAAAGEIVVMMDADLQDDPAALPLLIEGLDDGLDVVVGWRAVRRDSLGKRLQSHVFNRALGLSGLVLHDHNCGFKVARAEVLGHVRLYGDMHRYMPILAHMRGFRVGERRVPHRPRVHGVSNYGLSRTYRGLFDLVTILFLKSFRFRPMHLLGPIGLVAMLGGFAGLAYLAALWLIQGRIGQRPLLVYSGAALAFGTQVLATALLAELMTTNLVRSDELYLVRQCTQRGPRADAPMKRAGATRGALPRRGVAGAEPMDATL